MEKSLFTCPKCGESLELSDDGKVRSCINGHCYDTAKSGYVNLNLNQSSKNHGDDSGMTAAREKFLNAGFYGPLREKLCEVLTEIRPETVKNPVIADAGCGNGWYGCRCASVTDAYLAGIDMSVPALKAACRQAESENLKHAEFAAASVYRIPVTDETADVVLNIFRHTAKANTQEYLKAADG